MLTYIIGFAAQIMFSARMLIQWIMSERAHRVLSPALYWIFSIAGAYLFVVYGWMRDDFAIILGQFISYYVYAFNLHIKGLWQKIPVLLRWLMLLTPLVAAGFAFANADDIVGQFFKNEDIPLWLIIFGSAGQVMFTFRFIYQWYVAWKTGKSVLPPLFWIISLVGSTAITIYGVIRLDPVLIVGQGFGLVAYARNLWLCYHPK